MIRWFGRHPLAGLLALAIMAAAVFYVADRTGHPMPPPCAKYHVCPSTTRGR